MRLRNLFIYLCLLPTLVYGQLLTEKDKQIHFTAGVITSALTYDYVYRKTNNNKKALAYSIASAVLVGTLKEFIDSREKNNRFDPRDLLATTYGGLTIGLTFNFVYKPKKRKNKF